VIACLALFVALTGTGIATVSQVLPRNSVGTRQIQNLAVTNPKIRDKAIGTRKIAINAVTTEHVRNNSLRADDFAPGEIPAGPAGPAGPTGAAGPAGPAGPGARWALVRPDGGIAAQSGGITLAGHTTGRYYVNFGSAITGKLISVSPGFANDSNFRGVTLAGPCGGPPEGLFCVTSDNSSTVLVVTNDDDNLTVQDHSFYITVIG
jgi:hypothetical protein